ncbi:MAG: COX15/CtaA family protein [Gammaproteobacteria bacterium]|nr:COX15/CtaA family protein [Gammaproteobacteria bacterium]
MSVTGHMDNKRRNRFRNLALVSCALALLVVVLGAYVRLSDAGLGCPDWPGCYGHLLGVPESEQEILQANRAFPQRAVEADKAWKEMAHRYFAGVLGILIAALAVMALRNRKDPGQPVGLPVFLVGLVIFQALLGMWTVTLLLKPVIVMLHLLGGFAVLSFLWWVYLDTGTERLIYRQRLSHAVLPMLVAGLLLLIGQIILGGWTSANYAALACIDFPTCQGQWWPPMDFKEGFVFWRGLGTNYEFGVLDNPARTAIHLSHRYMAVVVAAYWLVLLIYLLTTSNATASLRIASVVTLLLLLGQLTLGVSNIVLHLPIAVAVMHNGGAVLLLLSVVTLVYLAHSEAGR